MEFSAQNMFITNQCKNQTVHTLIPSNTNKHADIQDIPAQASFIHFPQKYHINHI